MPVRRLTSIQWNVVLVSTFIDQTFQFIDAFDGEFPDKVEQERSVSRKNSRDRSELTFYLDGGSRVTCSDGRTCTVSAAARSSDVEMRHRSFV